MGSIPLETQFFQDSQSRRYTDGGDTNASNLFEHDAFGSGQGFIDRLNTSHKLLEHDDVVYTLFGGLQRWLGWDDDKLGQDLVCIEDSLECCSGSEEHLFLGCQFLESIVACLECLLISKWL